MSKPAEKGEATGVKVVVNDQVVDAHGRVVERRGSPGEANSIDDGTDGEQLVVPN